MLPLARLLDQQSSPSAILIGFLLPDSSVSSFISDKNRDSGVFLHRLTGTDSSLGVAGA